MLPSTVTHKALRQPQLKSADAINPTDLSNDRKLVGFADNVFVAKVIEQVAETPLRGRVPATQFSVHVIYNVKGSLQGTVLLSQIGTGHEKGLQVALENDRPLQPGATYLFATTYDDVQKWWEISAPPYDRSLINQNASLSDVQLRSLAESNTSVKALTVAYPNEILDSAAVYHRMAYNSYQSRHYDSSGQLIDDTVELQKQIDSSHLSPVVDAPANITAPAVNTSTPSPVPLDTPVVSPDAYTLPSDSPSISPATDSMSSPASDSPSATPTSDAASPTPSDTSPAS